MTFEFTKMQALGNDYIFINAFIYPELIEHAPQLARLMSDRHFGVGGDGIIFAAKSDKGDCAMRMFNADGSESEMCGNGIRQLSYYIFEKKISPKLDLTIETLAGIKTIRMKSGTSRLLDSIEVDMGAPILNPVKIPANAPLNQDGFSRINIEAAGSAFDFTLVSMGNPHAITFIGKTEGFDVEKYGKSVENNTALFPKRTNVEFIEVLARNEVNMRVWERGSGETLACGTGACASVVAASLNGLTDRKVTVHLLGGDLLVEWTKSGTVLMTGNAEKVFEGSYTFTW